MPRPTAAPYRTEWAQELRASVDARRELGPEYDEFVIQHFLDRLERRATWGRRRDQGSHLMRLFLSLLFSLPLTAIAGHEAGWLGILIVWGALFLLNFRFRR